MKTISTFVVAVVCTVALSSYALAGGHGHGHGHGHQTMPGDGMGMGGMGGMGHGGMSQAERSFFVNEAKAPAQKTSTTPSGPTR